MGGKVCKIYLFLELYSLLTILRRLQILSNVAIPPDSTTYLLTTIRTSPQFPFLLYQINMRQMVVVAEDRRLQEVQDLLLIPKL